MVLVGVLVLLSGSRLPDLGVTYPPPSTAIGIIYSLGLLRIGSGPAVEPSALSVSESMVDCREREPDRWDIDR